MKYIVFGLGSMGKRRIRCLQALGAAPDQILGFDLRADRRDEAASLYKVATTGSLDGIDWSEVRAMIVSTPPDKHQMYMRMAVEKSKPVFVEASVQLEGLEEIDRDAKAKGVLVAPSCTLRFHPAVKDMKRIVDSGVYGRVTSFSHYSGQYLPDWHPWENVKDFYVSKKETGACREIIPFELTWLTELIGAPEEVVGLFGKTMDVGADIDDTYTVCVKGQGCYGTVMVDVVARYAMRNLILNMEQGQIQWRWDRPEVNLYDAREKRWIVYKQRELQAQAGYNRNIAEEMYVDEIRAFLKAVEGAGPWPNSLQDDMRILGLLYRMEDTSNRVQSAHVVGATA
jgi:predicted dehydrogenase